MANRKDYPSFRDYYEAAVKEGNMFMYEGTVKGGHTPVVYGTDSKRIMKDDKGNWGIGQGGIFPTFDKEPELLDKDSFTKKMKMIGVSEETINKFFEMEVSMEDF